MLISLIPLFDENMAVCAYSVFAQKANQFMNPLDFSTRINDGPLEIPGFEVVKAMGVKTISNEAKIFVPISSISLFFDLAAQVGNEPHDRIVLLIDRTCPPVDLYVNRIKELKNQGFRFAIRKLAVQEFTDYDAILKEMDYVFLNNKKIAIDKAKIFFEKLYPQAKLIAGNIENQEIFELLKQNGGYALYEGKFYRVPLTVGSHEVAPVKATYLALLKVVNSPDFELTDAADAIGKDPALTISFLKMVNRVVKTSQINTIRHAAAMLGQKEMKRWINTAVTEQLYSDKPSEVTRVSLLRARMAEKLADVFELSAQGEELFLLGLFSVLDVILDKPMEEALDMIQVSNSIRDALVYKKGPLADVYNFLLSYEAADWVEVSRVLVVKNIDMDAIYEAYLESLTWYRNNFGAE